MTAAAARAMLDRQLAANGQTVALRRFTGSSNAPLATWIDMSIRVKSVPVTGEEVAGGIFSSGSKLIASPTDTGSDAVKIGQARIVQNDGATVDVIRAWRPIKMGDQVVRIELQAG